MSNKKVQFDILFRDEEARKRLNSFTKSFSNNLSKLQSKANSVRSLMIGVGGGVSAGVMVHQAAKLDKQLTNIGLNAGEGADKVDRLRRQLFTMSKQTGNDLNILQAGFGDVVAVMGDWGAASKTIEAINPAMAVTSANAEVLSSALTVAAESFNFDLAQAGKATELLDKMTVAGRQGAAELEDLAGIFARVGPSANAANLGFEKTLGLIEVLSRTERNPERLATLAESSLRLFTDEGYKSSASRALGVKFYDDEGAARDPLAILKEIQTVFKSADTERKQNVILQRAFGKTSKNVRDGLRLLLKDSALTNIDDYVSKINQAPGTIKGELYRANNNLPDQTARLGYTLRESIDSLTSPVRSAGTSAIRYLLDSKEEGGLGLSGNQLLGGGAAALALGGLGIFGARKGMSLLTGGNAVQTAAGVARGKALEKSMGVQPVYVVNMSDGGMGGSGVGGIMDMAGSILGGFGKGGMGGSMAMLSKIMRVGGPLAMLGIAGKAGWDVGTSINNSFVGDALADAIWNLSETMKGKDKDDKKKVDVNLTVNSKGEVELNDLASSMGVGFTMNLGYSGN